MDQARQAPPRDQLRRALAVAALPLLASALLLPLFLQFGGGWPAALLLLAGIALAWILAERRLRPLLRAGQAPGPQHERANRLFAMAVAQSADTVEISDADFRLIYVNAAFERHCGYTPAEALGRTPAELLRSEHHDPAFFAEIEARMAAGETWTGRLVSRHKDGRPIFQQASVAPLRDDHGRVTNYVAIKHDIGAQERIERELRESQASFHAFFAHAPLGMYLKDVDGRYLMVDDNITEVTGRGVAETVGRTAAELFPPHKVAHIEAADRELLRLGRPTTIEEYDPDRTSYRWSLVIRFPIRDSQDRITHIGGFHVDISERKAMEESLRASEQRFRALSDAHPVPLLIIDLASAAIIFASPPFAKLLGHSAELLTSGAKVQLLARPSDRHQLLAALEAQGALNGHEVELLRADGTTFWAGITARITPFQGVRAAVVAITDLTERKAAEAEIERQREALHQREKLSALGSLLAGVAHELNNPLSVVVGYALMLRDMAEDDRLRQRAERIHGAAERCARIVRTFLAMARQKPQSRGPVDLHQTIEIALEIAAYALRSSDVAIELDLADDLPPVWGDPDQLHQVILNLVINAEQALQECEPPRHLRIATARADDMAELTIADNGPGIAPAVRKRIFEPFFTTKTHGTGIGLAVCHSIIEAHGGRIDVHSTPGEGTRFVLELPDASSHQDSAVVPRATLPAPPRARILVVDDEPDIAELLQEVLTREGHSVVHAASGQEALDRLDGQSFELIISDLRMPDIDGIGLYRTLAARRPELLPRLILMTGDTLGNQVQTFLAETGAMLLEKPLDLQDVRRVVALRLHELATQPGPTSRQPA